MKKVLITFVLSVFISSADAALIDRGDGFIYDDVLDITWTQDANIRDGDGPFGSGSDTWANQVAWAAGLSIVDTRPGAGGVTYSDWRLPSMDVNGDDTIVNCSSATELACRDNEYGFLFWQYSVSSLTPGLFTNVQANFYWSGTEFASNPSNAWNFSFRTGFQRASSSSAALFAWAVRPGDVSVVPVPAAVWLFGSALLGLLGVWRTRR